MKRFFTFIFIISFLPIIGQNNSVVINEFMSSNSTTIADVDGDFSDWIELYNPTTKAVNLQGWGLSDNESKPFKWVFPNVTIGAGEYLLVFASGKDKTQGGEIHTSYSISADGEPLVLTDRLGNTIHYIPENAFPSDISYGLKRDGSGFGYFANPTPGAENSNNSYTELSNDKVGFSHNGGFYSDNFQLELSVSNNSNAKIYYTLDGSEPSLDNLGGTEYSYAVGYPFGLQETAETKTYLYTGSIEIKDKTNNPYQFAKVATHFASSTQQPIDNIFKGTVVRARVIDNDVFYPTVVGNTYFVTNEGEARFDLPVVSLITDPAGLFNYENGIYVPGKIMDDWRESVSPDEYDDNSNPANYNQTGAEWQRPGHFSYFGVDDDSYDKNIAIRINQGNLDSSPYRKSLRLYAKNNYDLNEEFDFPFFDDLKTINNTPINNFNRLLLRNSGNDYNSTLYRDALSHTLAQKLPIMTQVYSPVVHFVNGEYWGIINLRERYDKYYFASHFNISEDDIAVLNHFARVDVGNLSDAQDFINLYNYAKNNDVSTNSVLDEITKQLDCNSMLNYFAAEIYFANSNFPANNQSFWRYKQGVYAEDTPFGLDGRWSWILNETDLGLGYSGSQEVEKNELERLFLLDENEYSTLLFRRILDNNIIKNNFVNIVSDQINSCFKPNYVSSKVDEFNARLASSRAEHYNRWQSGTDEGESIKTFAQERPAYVRQHTREHFNLGDDYNVVISREGNGEVKINTIQINSELPGVATEPYPWSGKYFGGVPIKLKAIENDSTVFAYWKGDVPESKKYNKEIEIEINENSSFTAVFEEVKRNLIHYWHFNDLGKNELELVEADESLLETYGAISYPGTGEGYMDRVKEGTDMNVQNEEGDGNALRVRNPSDSRSLEISVPTSGYEKIMINYAVTRTSKGAKFHSIYYKTNLNENPILFRENIIINETFRIVELDFSSVVGVNNNENFTVIIKFVGDEASGDSGNTRFDNITVTGFSLKESTKISNVDNFNKLNVYPNPVKDNINITSVEKINDIQIVDINGRVVLYEFVDNYEFVKDISFLVDGIYILQIKCDSGVEMRKIIKNR